MTRPFIFHHASGDWAKRATCGALLSRVHYEESPEYVTCKRCLKLIGAQRPSEAPADRASAVKPVERRATAGASDSTPGRCSKCGFKLSYINCAPRCQNFFCERDEKERLRKRCAHLEATQQKLDAIIEAWDKWMKATERGSVAVLWLQLKATIEAGRSK